MGRNYKERQKEIERRVFSYDEKDEILLKSKCKCAKCGYKIDKYAMTIEHIIPVSKGGTNDAENIIGLCYECNRDKGNDICEPEFFYKNLTKKAMREAREYVNEYMKNYNWLSMNNFLPYDRTMIEYYIIRDIRDYNKCARAMITLRKAVHNDYESDFERLYDFIYDYDEKYGISNEGLDELILSYFEDGVIYYIEVEGDIRAVFPVKFHTVITSDERQHYCLWFNNPMTIKDNPTYGDLALSVLKEITGVVFELCRKENVEGMQVMYSVYYGTKYVKEILRNLVKDHYSILEETLGSDNFSTINMTYNPKRNGEFYLTKSEEYTSFDRFVTRHIKTYQNR